jgi:hypothetical protein
MGRDSRNNNKKKCSWLLASASTLVDSAAAAHLHCHAKGWRCRHVMRVIDRGEKCTAAGAAPQPTHALQAAYPSRKTPQQLNGGSRVRAGKRLRMLCFKHLLVQQPQRVRVGPAVHVKLATRPRRDCSHALRRLLVNANHVAMPAGCERRGRRRDRKGRGRGRRPNKWLGLH